VNEVAGSTTYQVLKQIDSIQGGITHAFVVEFENTADRDYYCKEDPIHQEFVRSLSGIIEKAQAIDYTPGVY
jgi:hypothetical protein